MKRQTVFKEQRVLNIFGLQTCNRLQKYSFKLFGILVIVYRQVIATIKALNFKQTKIG